MGCLYELGLIFRPNFSILPRSLAPKFYRNLFRLKKIFNLALGSTNSIFRVGVSENVLWPNDHYFCHTSRSKY